MARNKVTNQLSRQMCPPRNHSSDPYTAGSRKSARPSANASSGLFSSAPLGKDSDSIEVGGYRGLYGAPERQNHVRTRNTRGVAATLLTMSLFMRFAHGRTGSAAWPPVTNFACGSALGKPCGLVAADLAPRSVASPDLPSNIRPVALETFGNQPPSLHVIVGNDTVNMLFDTGSPEAVVDSAFYLSGPQSKHSDRETTLFYGGGQINVTLSIDELTVPGALRAKTTLAIADDFNTFAEGLDLTSGEVIRPYGGLLGMGPTQKSLLGLPTFRAAAQPQQGTAGVFSLRLCDQNADFYPGGYQADHIRGAIRYHSLLQGPVYQGWYTTLSKNVRLGNTTLSAPGGTTAMVWDSGTSALRLPQTLYWRFTKSISDALGGGYTWGEGPDIINEVCRADNQTVAELDEVLPKFSFDAEELLTGATVSYDLPASQSYLVPLTFDGDNCHSIQVSQNTAPGYIDEAIVMGTPALRSFLVAHDPDNARLGLALQDQTLCD